MGLTTLSEEEFRSFAENNPHANFMQTPEMGKWREKNGWKKEYLGLKEDNKLIAATMLLSKKKYFNKYEFYALRGPLLDFGNEKLVEKFMKELEVYVKNHNGYCLRIDPYLAYKQRDGAGNYVENGFDNSQVVNILKKQGFKRVAIEKQEQVNFMYALDVENKTEEEILKKMKPHARNIIRKVQKYGIEIQELGFEELELFDKIMIETSKRKGFSPRNLAYYQNMYKLFSKRNEIKYLVTKLNLKKHKEILNKEKQEQLNSKEKLSPSKNNDGKRKAIDETIGGIEEKIKIADEIEKEYGEEIILSGSMFMINKQEVLYLFSGNYEKFLVYNSQYLIQWEMIKYAIEHGMKRYNFYGIPDNFDKNSKDYGIYEFKTNFNGYVEELIGEYILPTSIIYKIVNLIHH